MLNHFNFRKLGSNFLVTNDTGGWLSLAREDFQRLVTNKVDDESDLYQKLRQNSFILEPVDVFSPEITRRLRSMKEFAFTSTSLHIFVLTNQCNLRCIYCQAQAEGSREYGMMSLETGKRAIDIALSSPENQLTFEFQGGEPLLNFPVLREMVLYGEQAAERAGKRVNFTLVSNLCLLDEEKLSFLMEHQVSISTSLDGPQDLHAMNRRGKGKDGCDSYQMMLRGVELLKTHGYAAGAIETTTRKSLSRAKDIVRTYKELGFNSIFLRPLTPLGFAKEDWKQVGYTAEEFLNFYKDALEKIIELCQRGTELREQHAAIFLRKILCGEGQNYMELRSPCGAGIGQLAYYWNGDIYTCDEARMVSEAGDQAFRLGNVRDSQYHDLIQNNVCKTVCAASMLETIPGCSDCAYQSYCGVCPVINYALSGDIFRKNAGGYRCEIYGGILDCLFTLLTKGTEAEKQVLRSWVE